MGTEVQRGDGKGYYIIPEQRDAGSSDSQSKNQGLVARLEPEVNIKYGCQGRLYRFQRGDTCLKICSTPSKADLRGRPQEIYKRI